MSMDAKKEIGPSDGEELGGGPDRAGQGENALMPDIYATQAAPEATNIKVLSRSTDDDDESVGFDPYDTATLYKK